MLDVWWRGRNNNTSILELPLCKSYLAWLNPGTENFWTSVQFCRTVAKSVHNFKQSFEAQQNELLTSSFHHLWSIWNHRNMVLHQGQIPNLVKVILISQSLTCRYQEAFNQSLVQEIRSNPKQTKSIPHQNWQILIKVVIDRNRKARKYGFAFEATTLDGSTLFKGGANSGRQSIYMETQEALVE